MGRFTAENVARARDTIARYPQARSALIPMLHLAQEQDGFLAADAMEHIAELLDLAPAEVLGTASFYEMFKRHHTGQYLIGVCTNISCQLNGADDLLEHAERSLGVVSGGTTDDGVITLERMECLAACAGAPCIQVNYRYVENVSPAAFDSLVSDLRANRRAEEFPPHGTLSRVPLPVPVTPAVRNTPEEL
jgi:NADH-quinone oxidoreductase subunit E